MTLLSAVGRNLRYVTGDVNIIDGGGGEGDDIITGGGDIHNGGGECNDD